MEPTLIDGKYVAAKLRASLQEEINTLKAQGHVPGLAVVLVGNDPASQVYVGSKVKACAELGLYSQKWELPAETTQEELVELIHQLNADDRIHGILVQSPPPPHIDEEAVIIIESAFNALRLLYQIVKGFTLYIIFIAVHNIPQVKCITQGRQSRAYSQCHRVNIYEADSPLALVKRIACLPAAFL